MGLATYKGIPTMGLKGDLNLGPPDDKSTP